jgi:hypothetical protein
MKLSSPISCARVQIGYLLLECLVYIAVFAVVTGLALATFYLCWENSRALRYTTDDVAAALRAGERWRADVRSATGTITIEHTAAGELLRIPSGTNDVLYRFTAGKMHRQSSSSGYAESILTAVGASQMVMDRRGPVQAWRWELELEPHREITHRPLQFSFEAAKRSVP